MYSGNYATTVQHHARARGRAGDWAIGRLGRLGRFWALIRAHLALRTYARSTEPRTTPFAPRNARHGLGVAHQCLGHRDNMTAQCLGQGRRGRGRGRMAAQWLDRVSHGRDRGHQRAHWLGRGRHGRGPGARPRSAWARPGPHD